MPWRRFGWSVAASPPVDFALNHPAGSLDKQLTLTAADLMVSVSKLHALKLDTSLPEVNSDQEMQGLVWLNDLVQAGLALYKQCASEIFIKEYSAFYLSLLHV